MPTTDLPSEAGERLERAAFSSGLTIPDFAACLHMGMRPVGLVQGYCVMKWSWYGAGSMYGRSGMFGRSNWGTTLRSYNCPHGYVQSAEHRTWGENFQQPWVSQAWSDGFNTAYRRMLEEAAEAGAHGVLGVVDVSRHLIDNSIREFHIYGTAVVVDGAAPPASIWTSYLAGQRLAKLVEAGLTPVSVVASMASVRVWAVCATEILLGGGYDQWGAVTPGDEITQMSDAQMQGRHLARDQVRSLLGHDSLHGALLDVTWHEIGEGDFSLDCTLRGTRVRRVRDAEPLPAPVPTVRLR
ncbi:MAG: hypothetical protein ACRDYY_09065 [Acidimicrobiales bacterium]